MADQAFVDQVRDRVESCGISMYELAKRTGVDKSALSRFLSGERWLSETAINAIAAEIGLELKKQRRRLR